MLSTVMVFRSCSKATELLAIIQSKSASLKELWTTTWSIF